MVILSGVVFNANAARRARVWSEMASRPIDEKGINKNAATSIRIVLRFIMKWSKV